MSQLFIARCVAAITTIILGVGLQYLLWGGHGKPFFTVLFSWFPLWILYILIGLLAGEHTFRLLSIRRDNAKKSSIEENDPKHSL